MICVDASVAVKWVLQAVHTDQARALYYDTFGAGVLIVAPPLMPIEATNILRQRMRIKPGFSLDIASTLLGEFLEFRDTVVDPPELHLRTLVIADAHQLPAAYDAHHLTLSELLACEFWTADQRLLRQVGGRLPMVRWIGDYRAAER
jgi:predicted nucleic acid-binding protein